MPPSDTAIASVTHAIQELAQAPLAVQLRSLIEAHRLAAELQVGRKSPLEDCRFEVEIWPVALEDLLYREKKGYWRVPAALRARYIEHGSSGVQEECDYWGRRQQSNDHFSDDKIRFLGRSNSTLAPPNARKPWLPRLLSPCMGSPQMTPMPGQYLDG